jgi:hypothetical protein
MIGRGKETRGFFLVFGALSSGRKVFFHVTSVLLREKWLKHVL